MRCDLRAQHFEFPRVVVAVKQVERLEWDQPSVRLRDMDAGFLQSANIHVEGIHELNDEEPENVVEKSLKICARNSGVKLFLDRGAQIEAKDSRGRTPLMYAAAAGQVEVVRLLLAKGASVTARGNQGPALWEAARSYAPSSQRKVETMQALIEAGADVNAVGLANETVLMAAIDGSRRDDDVTARFLVEHGARVNDADKNGWTPTMFAIRHGGGAQLVSFLLAHGADPNARAKDGQTVLLIAANASYPSRPDVVSVLLDHGADANASDPGGVTPLMRVAAVPNKVDPQTDAAAIRALLAHGADAHARDREGRGALDHTQDCGSEPAAVLKSAEAVGRCANK